MAASLTTVAIILATAAVQDGAIAAASGRPAANQMPACAKTYDVVSGDYWIKIASKTGVTTSALYAANNASASTALYPGMQICLPDSATVPTTTPAPTTTVPVADG